MKVAAHISASVYCEDACILAEGPFWHDDQLWWVDIERGLLLSADEQGKLLEEVGFGQRIGSAVPTGGRTFLLALERELVRFDLDAEGWETVARLDDLPPGSRFNDGKCDPRGRLIVGTISPEGCRGTASLYALHQNHSLHHLRGEITVSNGLAWTSDGQTMYYIDTAAQCVFAYQYDLEAGSISRERVVLRFSENEGWPDGMAIDREGRLWIAFWDGWAVRCYRTDTGLCEAIVPLPCARVTSCCFGGEDASRLFITTARRDLSEEELLVQPLAGSVFVCDPGTRGYPTIGFSHREP